jgi:acid stress-induced BolA-like protein IbaG/YrbA
MTASQLQRILAQNIACQHLVVDGDGRHWMAEIVSAEFHGFSRIRRHQHVYAALGERIQTNEVHALSIKAFTPAEWAAKATTATATKF